MHMAAFVIAQVQDEYISEYNGEVIKQVFSILLEDINFYQAIPVSTVELLLLHPRKKIYPYLYEKSVLNGRLFFNYYYHHRS
jgi:hypothetical protein